MIDSQLPVNPRYTSRLKSPVDKTLACKAVGRVPNHDVVRLADLTEGMLPTHFVAVTKEDSLATLDGTCHL